MKEEDLQRLFHRPPGPHALLGWTAADTGRPHPAPPAPPPHCRPASGQFPGKPRSTAASAQAGSGRRVRPQRGATQPFLPAHKHPGTRRGQEFHALAGGPEPPARPLPAASGEILPRLVLGRGRRPHRPSPAANTKGPAARGETACRPEPDDRSAGGPQTPNSPSQATRRVAERSFTRLPEGNTPA